MVELLQNLQRFEFLHFLQQLHRLSVGGNFGRRTIREIMLRPFRPNATLRLTQGFTSVGHCALGWHAPSRWLEESGSRIGRGIHAVLFTGGERRW